MKIRDAKLEGLPADEAVGSQLPKGKFFICPDFYSGNTVYTEKL